SDDKTYLYRFATGKWEAHDLMPRPNGKKGKTYSTIPRLAYDSRNEICLGLIWDDATGKHETWTLDVSKLEWKKVAPRTEPDPSMSRSRNLAFWPEKGVFILDLNPSALNGKGSQIWTYRCQTATPIQRLASPTSVQANTDTDRVSLSWPSVKGAAEYRVYRSLGAEPWQPKFERIANVKEALFVDDKIPPKQPALYMVRAVDGNGIEGDDSPSARSAPRVAVKPVVSVLAKHQIEISWDRHPATDI